MLHDTSLWHGKSRFAKYEVVEQRYGGRPARLLFSGEREAVQSGIALDDDPDLLFDYNQRFLELVRAREPRRALLIGGGALTLPTALFIEFPELILDVVERDALLIEVATDYFGFKPRANLNVYHVDGRDFLDGNTVPYDLILVDAFSHLQVPPRLSTVEAVQSLRRNLPTSGGVAVNVVSPYYGLRAGIIRQQMVTYASVFAQVQVYAAAATQTGWQMQNLVLMAQDDQTTMPFRFAPLPTLDLSKDQALYDSA